MTGARTRRVARRLGWALLVVLIAVGAALATARGVSLARQRGPWQVPRHALAVPSDAAARAEGERLYVTRGCADCHRDDGGGRVFLDIAPCRAVATNLTAFAAHASPTDWDRAVRHGVAQDGRALVMMPAEDYRRMSDHELGRLAAYVSSLPRVENELPPSELRWIGSVLDVLGVVPMLHAARIDHAAAHGDVPAGRTRDYGEVLADGCVGCHGAQLSGGAIPGAPPELGVPPNLTPHETGLARWSEQDFVRAIREGVTPSGERLDPAQMPYPQLARMTDDELGALYLYLRSLPPREEGGR